MAILSEGDVKNSQDCKNTLSDYIDITFFTQDAAALSLILNFT
jgi:hypothetical protein